MGDILAGGTLTRLPKPQAAVALPFFEYAPKPPLPTLATLARFAKQLPGPLRCALVAPRGTWLTSKGPLRPSPELDSGFEWLKRASDILQAAAIVLPTGAELTTGERDSALLAAFVERLKTTNRLVVIAPRGLWEAEHGVAFAHRAGCVYGFDPLEDDAPEGDVLYARVRPMGARPRLTDGHLSQIAERLLRGEAELSYVAVESEQAMRDARRLQKALGELSEELAAFTEQGHEDEDQDEDEDEDQDEDEDEDQHEDQDEDEDEDQDEDQHEDQDEDQDER